MKLKNMELKNYNVINVNYGESALIEKYSACASYDLAIYILEFIRSNYEKHSSKDFGCQKYIDAINIGIDAIKEKQLKES